MKITDNPDLLRRAKDFDLQALGQVYDLYSPGLFNYAYRLLGDVDLAEDCVAETFSRFLNALKAGKGPQDYLQAYLFRIAHNWITDLFRRQSPIHLPLDENLVEQDGSHPEHETVRRLEQEEVRNALRYLTPDQRQIILLKFIEGWDNESVATTVNKPVSAVKSLQHRALESLRRMLGSREEEKASYEIL